MTPNFSRNQKVAFFIFTGDSGINICPYFLKYFRERFSNFEDLGKGFGGRKNSSPIFIKERKKEMEIS